MGFFKVQAWERREENKGISEKAQTSGKEGLVCACGTIWSSVCLKEMPLGGSAWLPCVGVRDCLDWLEPPKLFTQKLAPVARGTRSPAPTPRGLRNIRIWAVALESTRQSQTYKGAGLLLQPWLAFVRFLLINKYWLVGEAWCF